MVTIPVSQQSDNFKLPKTKQITVLPYHTILHDTILRVSGGLFIFWVDATLADFVLGAPLSRLFRLELPIDLS